MTTAADLIRSNDLSGARAMLVEAVKRAPADASARYALAEVLILQGDFERADTHLDMASTQDPTLGTLVALLRQLVRAAVHREEVFTAGRSPDLVTEPTPVIETALRILLESRQGDDAAALREEADEAAPELSGVCDGTVFTTLRDLDDRTADVLELLTPTGKYVWAPWSQVVSLAAPPRVWRPAERNRASGSARPRHDRAGAGRTAPGRPWWERRAGWCLPLRTRPEPMPPRRDIAGLLLTASSTMRLTAALRPELRLKEAATWRTC